METPEPETESRSQLSVAAVSLVKDAKLDEREALRVWLEKLLEIRNKNGTRLERAKAAIIATKESKIVWRLLKLIAKEVRRHGWDERSRRTRWATVAAGISIAAFGGQSAGIAALGGAIGVPLWVVFGGGAAFARVLLDEIQRTNVAAKSASTAEGFAGDSEVIEGSFVDVTPDE